LIAQTPAERAEYDAWADSVNAQGRDPNPEDLRISYLEMVEQDLWKEARLREKQTKATRLGYIPFDEELDKANDLSGWERQITADDFAVSFGYRDAHHLQGTQDLLSAVLEMKALEAEIEFRNKRIALMEANLAMMQGGQS
jgi:hypothetical protein